MLTILAMPATSAFAAHPMLSEDTGTQGSGNAELELGNSWARDQGNHTFLFQPQLSYGYSPTLDLIVQPSWLRTDAPSHLRGFGDTNLDAKWRFFGAAPWSLGIRAGLEVATAENSLGLPHGKVSTHAVLVATADATPFTLDLNLGYAHYPETAGLRRDLYHATGAAMYAINERLNLTLDIALASNPDTTRTNPPATLLAGIIYTLRPGLDVDAGYMAGLNTSATEKQCLFGITYHWAP